MAAATNAKPKPVSTKKRKPFCLVHLFPKDRTRIVRFSEKSWQKACDCANEWLNLDGEQKRISATAEHRHLWTVPFDPSALYGYHHACYSDFTNKTNLERARKRKARLENTLPISFTSRAPKKNFDEQQFESLLVEGKRKRTLNVPTFFFHRKSLKPRKSRKKKSANAITTQKFVRNRPILPKQSCFAAPPADSSSRERSCAGVHERSELLPTADRVKNCGDKIEGFEILQIKVEDLQSDGPEEVVREAERDGGTPSLDPNSANPWIMISQDLRTATRTSTKQMYPEHPDRFDVYQQVLSSESFSSGCHYWEVDVSLSRWCRIGVAFNSMGRKGGGKEHLLGGNSESWCLQKYYNQYSAWHNDERTLLTVPGDPERFGFFLECEAGELRCFGDSRVLHVFKGNFMDPVNPAIGVYNHVGDSVRFCSL